MKHLDQHAHFQALFENAPLMICSFSAKGSVLLWNPACTNILGYSPEEVRSASDALALFYPDALACQQVKEDIFRAEGKFRPRRVKRRDGQFLHQMWASFRLPEGGVISTGYDVTEIEDLQERVRNIHQTLAERVEARSREAEDQRAKLLIAAKFAALGEMAGGVAHEINNPLAIIDGFTSQLIERTQSGQMDPSVVLGMLQKIRSGTERIIKIVAGLKSISRDGSRDPKLNCQMKDVLAEVLGICRERFHNFGTELGFEGQEVEASFHGRPVEMQQVILNLLNNAFDAVQGLAEKWVKVSLSAGANEIRVAVSNSGAGVSPEIRDKIFQPFFTTKEIGKGTGLGLSISRSIVEAHGGSLLLDHEAKATTFLIRLPRAKMPSCEKN